MRLLLIADTHVPKRARDLPQRVWDEVARADVVVHAGDWVDACAPRRARGAGRAGSSHAGATTTVTSYVARLPERADVTAGRRAVHRRARDGRRPAGARRGWPRQYPDTDVLVFGHSHIPWDTTADNRAATAQSGLADRPQATTVLHLHDRDPSTTVCCPTSRCTVSGSGAMPDRRARVADVHEIACGHAARVTRIEGPKGNPIYQVGGKSFVFFRTPQPDAEDPETGERYADVIMIWVESESRQAGARSGPAVAVLHHRPVRRAPVGVGARQRDYAESARAGADRAHSGRVAVAGVESPRRRRGWPSTAARPAIDDLEYEAGHQHGDQREPRARGPMPEGDGVPGRAANRRISRTM